MYNFIINATDYDNSSLHITLYYDFFKYLIDNKNYIYKYTKIVFQFTQLLFMQISLIIIGFVLLKTSNNLISYTYKQSISEGHCDSYTATNVYHDIESTIKKEYKYERKFLYFLSMILSFIGFACIFFSYILFRI